jgi:hypothetical protein
MSKNVLVFVKTIDGMDISFRFIKTLEVHPGCNYLRFVLKNKVNYLVPGLTPCADTGFKTKAYDIKNVLELSYLSVIVIESEEAFKELMI